MLPGTTTWEGAGVSEAPAVTAKAAAKARVRAGRTRREKHMRASEGRRGWMEGDRAGSRLMPPAAPCQWARRRRRAGAHPLVGPAADGVEGPGQRAPLGCEGVLDPHRRLRDHLALDDGLLLQLLQALAEHAVGDAGDGGPELREAAAPLEEDVDDGPRPAAADQLAGPVEQAADRRREHARLAHGPRISDILDKSYF